jgi:flagellar FliJ protein
MARTFDFSLQPLLDRRACVEEEKKQVLALRQRACDEAARKLKHLNDELSSRTDAFRQSARALPPGDLRVHDAHLRFLQEAIEAQARIFSDRHVAVERATEELIAASRERKVVEKLKERRRRDFDARASREGEIELDESNARQHERLRLAKA